MNNFQEPLYKPYQSLPQFLRSPDETFKTFKKGLTEVLDSGTKP